MRRSRPLPLFLISHGGWTQVKGEATCLPLHSDMRGSGGRAGERWNFSPIFSLYATPAENGNLLSEVRSR